MLEGMEKVGWGKLSHAYGKASDVPLLLREVAAGSADALFKLGAAICHQGTLFAVTARVVPFLVELAAERKLKGRAGILRLLGDIATVDDHAAFWFDGIDALRPHKAVLAVREGVETYAALLVDKDASVRAHAAFVLAWIPSAPRTAMKKAALKEKNTVACASMCLALAQHGEAAKVKGDEVVATAAAIAEAHVKRGEVGKETRRVLARAPALAKVDGLPWFDGDLGGFSVRVLAAMEGMDDALLEAVRGGSLFAANVLVRRAISPALMSAIAALPRIDGDLKAALDERGVVLPKPKRAHVPPEYLAASDGKGGVRAEAFDALCAGRSPAELVALAFDGLAAVDAPWSAAVAFELVWRNAAGFEPRAGDGLVAVAVGIGLVCSAKSAPPVEAEVMLQQAYGFWPRVADAVALLPAKRRDAWLLDEKRDTEVQPTEDFLGAWPYWCVAPSPAVAERALAHVAKWKSKDKWGGARKKYADPHLAALATALRAAGHIAEAKRCEVALRTLR
jgi:hypothetical protein